MAGNTNTTTSDITGKSSSKHSSRGRSFFKFLKSNNSYSVSNLGDGGSLAVSTPNLTLPSVTCAISVDDTERNSGGQEDIQCQSNVAQYQTTKNELTSSLCSTTNSHNSSISSHKNTSGMHHLNIY